MRTSFLAVCSLLLIAVAVLPSAGQTRFAAGMRVGMNLGTISIDPDIYQITNGVSKKGRTGILIGGIAEVEFARMFCVEVSPTFAMKGGGYQDDQGGSDVVKYSELELPILFKVRFLPGQIQPYAFVGPNLGIMMSATRSLSPAQGQGQDVDIKSNTSGIDFALDFGGGVEYGVAKSLGIFLDVRYSLGLSNLNSAGNNQNVPGATVPTVKTSGLQIMAGTLFHF